MATSTLTVSIGTWYQDGDSTNHSSDSWLRCQKETSSRGYGAILQFSIPNTLKYKRITKALLTYYTRCYSNGEEIFTDRTQGMNVAPYIISNSNMSQVTGASLETSGQKGEFITIESFNDFASSTYPRWRSADVTSLFNSNLYNNQYFTVIFKGKPGYGGTSYYGAIGGVGSGYAATLTLTYEDVTQQAPTPTYPVGAYVNENTDMLFSWAWNSQTQAVQASVQLEYKLASAGSWTVVNLTQSAHSYTLSGGLPQGAYQWRIKGTNDASETSDYSATVEFTVIGKPGVPVINTPANAALTEITWQANDQNSFDITLTDSNGRELINETVASSASSYKPNLLLKGTYTVGIRYRNSTGLSSDWAYKVFSITASGPAKPVMTLYGDGENARIKVDVADGIRYAIMRAEDADQNYKIIGLLDGDTYIDKTAKFNVGYGYKVRAFASAGYTDSDVAHFRCNSEKIALQTDELDIFLTLSEEEFFPYTEDATNDMAAYRCPGREFAIVEHSETNSCEFSSALFVTEKQKADVTRISKENYIYYRDYSGRAFPVAIRTLSFNRYMKAGYIADLGFLRIAEKEVILNV